MGLYERKSAVLDGFERRFQMGMFNHYLAEYLWPRSHDYYLNDEAFKAFCKNPLSCCTLHSEKISSKKTSSAIKRNHKRLTEVGLRSRRPLRRLPLTPHHRQCRLDVCRPRASVTDWRRVIFSDESSEFLKYPAFIVERHSNFIQCGDFTTSSFRGTLTARKIF
ncbi:hypothetical protein TNCV_3304281 [Trichonephila clavipes]|nr:hypothetical protein TNCV_3304281 [Trichonephila clavipes]